VLDVDSEIHVILRKNNCLGYVSAGEFYDSLFLEYCFDDVSLFLEHCFDVLQYWFLKLSHVKGVLMWHKT